MAVVAGPCEPRADVGELAKRVDDGRVVAQQKARMVFISKRPSCDQMQR